MLKYSKVSVKLTDIKLKKLKKAVKNKTGTTLRMSLKMFDRNDLPQIIIDNKSKNEAIVNTFQKIISKRHKPNKKWVD